MAPVRAWTSSEPSALVRSSCFLRALLLKIGAVSAGCVALSGSGRKLFFQRASNGNQSNINFLCHKNQLILLAKVPARGAIAPSGPTMASSAPKMPFGQGQCASNARYQTIEEHGRRVPVSAGPACGRRSESYPTGRKQSGPA